MTRKSITWAERYAFRNCVLKRIRDLKIAKERVRMILRVNLPRLTAKLLVTISLMALLVVATRPVFSATSNTVTLGSAASFAVLGGSTVTNTGPTVLTGDLGVNPGSAITGFPPGLVHGATHAADSQAIQAQNDLTKAYTTLAGLPCSKDLTDKDLGGMNLVPGVYCFTSSAQLTGTLTLNSPTPDALYVFQIGSTLTTASSSVVAMTGGLCGGNVFWQVGSSATLGTTTKFVGNIVALTSIHLTTGATMIPGRALARNGEVTLDSNQISNDFSGCASSKPDYTITSQTSVTGKTGGTMDVTVTFTPQNGFTGTVKLTATVLPSSGLTATLNQSTVSSSHNVTLTLNFAKAGTYTVSVRGTTNYLSHSVPITVTVTAHQEDTTVTPNPSATPNQSNTATTNTQTSTPSQSNTVITKQNKVGLNAVFYGLFGGLVALVAGTAILLTRRGVLSKSRTA